METTANESNQEESAVKAEPVNSDTAKGNGDGDNNYNKKPETDKKDQAAEKETEKKTRSSTKRKLASDKNILKKKRDKLINLKKKLNNLKAIRKRGYEVKEQGDGRVKCNFLSRQEITWYGIKIDNLQEEILYLEKEILDLRENFGRRVQSTKKAAQERIKFMRKEKKAKAKAKSLFKEKQEEILAAAKNGKAETLKAVVVAYKEDNKKDDAFKSLNEYMAKEMIPVHKELEKDPLVKAGFMVSVMKLLCNELQG